MHLITWAQNIERKFPELEKETHRFKTSGDFSTLPSALTEQADE